MNNVVRRMEQAETQERWETSTIMKTYWMSHLCLLWIIQTAHSSVSEANSSKQKLYPTQKWQYSSLIHGHTLTDNYNVNEFSCIYCHSIILFFSQLLFNIYEHENTYRSDCEHPAAFLVIMIILDVSYSKLLSWMNRINKTEIFNISK